jgi:antitoxin (DNA-binding transcriptional repressor) of toxin-antitoxin stability system
MQGGIRMDFYSVRELRNDSKNIWKTLAEGNEVVVTNNGKPSALMIDIPEGSFDDIVQAVRQARAMVAFNSMRRKAAGEGFMTEEEIEAEINAARNGD